MNGGKRSIYFMVEVLAKVDATATGVHVMCVVKVNFEKFRYHNKDNYEMNIFIDFRTMRDDCLPLLHYFRINTLLIL